MSQDAATSPQEGRIILGIDLGTTNSLVAVAGSKRRARVLRNAAGEALIPSVVHFPADGGAPPPPGRRVRRAARGPLG